MAKRRSPITMGRVGNYAADVDTSDMDEGMKRTMNVTKTKPMDKLETKYVQGAKNKDSALEAVRRARRANKVAPLNE